MPDYVLSFKPATTMFGSHDPSAAISRDGTIVFGIEEERLTRTKHASGTFPRRTIEACLDYAGVTLGELDRILVPYLPKLRTKIFSHDLKQTIDQEDGLVRKLGSALLLPKHHLVRHRYPLVKVKERLSAIDDAVPPVEMREHHACHAASAFHPSEFSEALVLTVDGRGEYDSTVVWQGTEDGLERVRTYECPNSLGTFYAIVTEFLGYRAFNGEGKVIGLAPYGSRNGAIESAIRSLVDTGADYDVTSLTELGREEGVRRLEAAFGRERNRTAGEFDEWEQDLAHTAQKLLEDSPSHV